MPNHRHRSDSDSLYNQLSPYWRRTGEQDYYNIGNVDEVAEEANISSSDSRTQAVAKIKKMLLVEVDLNSQVDSKLSLEERSMLTVAQKHKLVDAWATGRAEAAVRAGVLKAAR